MKILHCFLMFLLSLFLVFLQKRIHLFRISIEEQNNITAYTHILLIKHYLYV